MKKAESILFLFGYEESYGYLISPIVRDKDALQAALMVCEAAAFYKRKSLTLKDMLNRFFATHGWFCEGQLSIEMAGRKGIARIAGVMRALRAHPPVELAGLAVVTVEDYYAGSRISGGKKSAIGLPKTDAMKFILVDGSWVAARPSGTEPKCKFYFCAQGSSEQEAQSKLGSMREYFKRFG